MQYFSSQGSSDHHLTRHEWCSRSYLQFLGQLCREDLTVALPRGPTVDEPLHIHVGNNPVGDMTSLLLALNSSNQPLTPYIVHVSLDLSIKQEVTLNHQGQGKIESR